MTVKLITLSAVLAVLCLASAKCTMPTGIKDPSVFRNLPPNSPAPTDSVFFQHIVMGIPEFSKAETPIQFHLVERIIAPLYSTMGAFEDFALDVWGNEQPVRFCKGSPNFALYRSVTLAYACNVLFKDSVPALSTDFDALAARWGVDPNLCFGKAKPDTCDDITTPWGLVFYRYKQYMDWISRDGWNHDGSLNRRFNRIPFQDWTDNRYVPNNSPWRLTNKRRWQPLLEDNGIGFMFYQEHVTAHIGQFGRSFFVDDKTFCSRTAPNPRYNYAKELDTLIKRSAAMVEDNVVKAKVQIFDNKFTSLLLLQSFLVFANGISGDSWEFIEADMVGATSLYESGLLVWKEKIRHDAIRPPSRLRNDRAGRKITAYAGPYQGKQTILAEEWEPYIRTMPHAEYPSGSACSCTAFANAMTLFFGSDKFMAKGKVNPLSLTVAAGQSIAEPGLPTSNVTLTYSTWSKIAKDCGQSRLNGGMHFTAAVSEGAALCEPIGKIVFEAIKALSSGKKPRFIQDFKKPLQKKRRCEQRRN